MITRDWAQHATVTTGEIRREARFIRVSTGELYVSFYAHVVSSSRSIRLVVFPAWHADGDYGFEIAHHLCAGVAKNGGVAATFHWPGHGESDGDPRTMTMEQFVAAGEAVLDEMLVHHGPGEMAVAGVKVAAVPAIGLSLERSVSRLLLIEPDLDVDSHFAALERMARRTSLGKELPSAWASSRFLPQGLRETPVPTAPFGSGNGTSTARTRVIRYEAGASPEMEGVEEVVVPGTSRRRSPDHHLALRSAAIDWLSIE